ncbi:MAG: hypothetical protein Q3971_01715 [Moraxella sp.]|nr:hypothetical protein [Moraxella sp.]
MKHAVLLILLMGLTACDHQATEHNLSQHQPSTTEQAPSDDPHHLTALMNELNAHQAPDDIPDIKPIITPDGKTQIDWSLIHTKTTRADVATYDYPIALNSSAVKNYAQAHNITDKEAQHSIVIGMASPEVLGKVLDQLKDGKYLSHRLTDGADMMLIITTTSDVVADKAEYVFADSFGKGLVLPVVIEPTPPKPSS